MHLFRYCTAALLAATTIHAAAAQAPAVGQAFEGSAEFTLFISGSRVGFERVRVARAGTTWVISSTALYGPPLNITLNRFELKYTADWQPIEMQVEATQTTPQGSRTLGLATSFGVTTAINEITQNGVTGSKTDQISARTIVLPNNFYAAYEGLAARLASAQPGAELPVYVAPQSEIKVVVKAIALEQISTPSGPINSRRYSLALNNPDGVLEASVTIDARGRLVRLEIPTARLALVRSDLATVATRSQPIRNQNDTDVIIPATGFTLAGTLTMPPATGLLRHPAIVLVTGSGQLERDETIAGIPIFAQLAGSLAQEGFVVLRYDKRGIGQSGGRSERATLQDYADDLTAAVKWLAKRKDIDPKRIAVVGTQRRRRGRDARGGAREEDLGARAGRGAGDARRGSRPRTAAPPARRDEGARGGAAGQDRAAAADPRGGDCRQRVGSDPAGAARAGGLDVVQEPSPVRSGEADAEGQAAHADHPRGSRQAGAAAPRR